MSLAALDAKFPLKRALITGGASGLGLATAELLAARGWRLGLLDRDATRLSAVAADLRTRGTPLCEIHAVDVTDGAAVKSAVDEFAARCGGLDFAMNSAGVAVAGGIIETPAADWDWIMSINVMGVAHSCRAELPHMVASGGGLVVNIASAASFACTAKSSAYSASKAAVVAMSETLYQEFADQHVRVVAAMPGFFRTRLMEHARAPAGAAGFALKMMQASNLEADAVALEIVSRAAAGATHIVLPARYRWLWRFKRLAPRTYLGWMVSVQRRYAAHAAARSRGK